MNWKEKQKEKLSIAFSLLITVAIDLFLVVIVSALLELTKFALETYVFKQPLSDVDLLPFSWIYTISKVVIISGFVLYAINDIVGHMIHTFKSLKNG